MFHAPLYRPLLLALLSLATSSASAAGIQFSASDIAGWPTRSFEGESQYRVIREDGRQVLQARSQGQASAKYLERDINLNETPYLHWCWKVDSRYAGIDERSKSGDDYPARLYVARKTGLLPWQLESVNYVWSSTQPQGSRWPNAFTERAMLLALQGASSPLNEWRGEVRDIRADFTSLFGEDVEEINGLALMSDGDNAGGDAVAHFTAVGLAASPTPPNCPP
ncbi:DUF3047 domain-containing protein [Halomonas almeriensis]|uniref:DUF3047 domain-containing protein n=1 Tax=Halomonas almeriensis TaxID=308163 RepID=UPI0025B2A25A|nr:DUF3047 domain-containing protein [Halomonas almeriensis]MDN3552574.1 DUF3047 domain-containing protein [Halomonas almeriensis]